MTILPQLKKLFLQLFNLNTMDVKVIIEKWGNYIKGDVIEGMPESTAIAIIKRGVVEEVGEEKEVKPKKNTKK